MVDIKNLEKIEPEIVPSKHSSNFKSFYLGSLLFNYNLFDSNMIFRDMETKEIFVFDVNGVWNEDTLSHKLIYWDQNIGY